jgi:hypothetical protein
MEQISVPFASKIDAPLAALCNGPLTGPAARMPIVIRYEPTQEIEEIVARIVSLGGEIRHRLGFICAVAAWLPLKAVEPLSQHGGIRQLQLEQEFTIA